MGIFAHGREGVLGLDVYFCCHTPYFQIQACSLNLELTIYLIESWEFCCFCHIRAGAAGVCCCCWLLDG